MKLLVCLVSVCLLLTMGLLPPAMSADTGTRSVFPYNDVLKLPAKIRTMAGPMAGVPPAPGPDDLTEFLMGSVAVGVVLPESNGAIDPDTEDWDSARQDEVKAEIEAGLAWWTAQDARARLSFVYEYRLSIPTGYEPINHNGPFDERIWINDVMARLGYTNSNYFVNVNAYANDLRMVYHTDWAFVVFVVDSLNDPDGTFTSGYSGYAYLGGPFFMMTFDNDGYGITGMDFVAAHEMGHIFYATDEYNGMTERSGYLDVPDVESSGCIMHQAYAWCISSGTLGQIGWRDSDGDNIFDILDEPPTTSLVPYAPDPTSDTTPAYTGTGKVVALPNRNPYGPGNDVTISKVTSIYGSADGLPWQLAVPDDGIFDDASEGFRYTTPPLSGGLHQISARTTNNEGNRDVNPPVDTLTIDNEKPTSALRAFPSIVNVSLLDLQADASDNVGVALVELWYSHEGSAPALFDSDIASPWEWSVYTDLLSGDGNYSFYSVAVDLAFGTEDPPPTPDLNVLVDTAPPTSVLTPLPTYTNQSIFSVTASPSDRNGISSLELWLDFNSTGRNLVATLNSPPWTFSIDTGTLGGDGAYAFFTRANDVAGNCEFEHQLPDASTIVDTTPPRATTGALPQYTAALDFTVTAAASDLNGLAAVELWYRWNGGTWALFSTKSVEPWSWSFSAASLGEGAYDFASLAVDVAGNRETWSPTPEATTVVDVSPPTLNIIAPSASMWINETHALVEWTAFDAVSGLGAFRLDLSDGGTWTVPATATRFTIDWIADGFHTVTLTAWDRAGNFAVRQLTIQVDHTPPDLNITKPIDGAQTESPITVEWQGHDNTSGLNRYEYSVDGGEFVPFSDNTTVAIQLQPGAHDVRVRAYDMAGNLQETGVSFTVKAATSTQALTVLLPAILLLITVVTIVVILILRRRRKKEQKGPVLPPPPRL